MKVIVCGGGTGGHIYPALAIGAKLREMGAEVLYMGAKNSAEARLAESSGFAFFGVSACGLHKRSPRLFLDLRTNYRGLKEAKVRIRAFAPHIVIGTGGYAEAPIVKAAQMLGIKTMLHEQNAVPGLANRYLSRHADAVCLTFREAAAYLPQVKRLCLTGLPVRQQILSASKEAAFRYFNIPAAEKDCFTLLVTGGSLGAASLNKAAEDAYETLLAAGVRIIHVCGKENYEALSQRAPQHPRLFLRPYINEMEHALALADLACARCGASFLTEAACLGLPAFLVPYPYAANDHQRKNARVFAEAGAAFVIEDSDLNGVLLCEKVLALAKDSARLAQMSAGAKTLAQYDAAKKIAAIAYQLVKA